jgi:uncharacterized membrane protein
MNCGKRRLEMGNLKSFVKTSILGGVVVVMPLALFIFVFMWLFRLITNLIQPFTTVLVSHFHLMEVVADVFAVILILTGCFLVGILVKTKLGNFIQENFEKRIMNRAPGYALIKTTVMQFLGRGRLPFSSVALVRAFENNTLMTGFITEQHSDERYTVFVPTGPNPTTGYIFHLKKEFVHPVSVSAEEAFRSIISCGVGSQKIIQTYLNSL